MREKQSCNVDVAYGVDGKKLRQFAEISVFIPQFINFICTDDTGEVVILSKSSVSNYC